MEYTYKYPRPAVTADCVVMTAEEEPQILLIERSDDPYKGCWAFPGGFLNMDETTEQCAIRELEEETGLRLSKVVQIGAYSGVDRDPRGRTVTVAYLAIVNAPVAVTGKDDAAKAQWFSIKTLPQLAFDHVKIMKDAILLYEKLLGEFSWKQDMSSMEKVEVLESLLTRTILEQERLLDVRDAFILSMAATKFYAKVTLAVCENSDDPAYLADLCMEALVASFDIAANKKEIKVNKEKVKEIKSIIQRNNALIEKLKKEQAELMAEKFKKVKDTDIN